jgi:hypothetical protein
MTASGQPLFSNLQLATLTYLLLALDTPQSPPSPQRIDSNQPVTQEQDDAANVAATAASPPPIPTELEHVMWQVKDRLYDLIKAIFLDMVLTVETSQRELRANAKLEAALKKKKTLDLAKILETDLANQYVVAPANMQDLVNQLVGKSNDHQKQQQKKDLLKATMKEAQNKSLGGAKAAKTPPSKQDHGGKPNGGSNRAGQD